MDKTIKINSLLRLCYEKEGKRVEDTVQDIELDFFKDNSVEIRIYTKNGWIVYDDQIESIEVISV